MIRYDLNKIHNNVMTNIYKNIIGPEEEKIINTMNISIKKFTYNNEKYRLFRYDKAFLTKDMFTKTGLLRSVIFKNDKIIVFSPPKAEDPDIFIQNNKPEDCYAQDFIEGTMINMFYDNDKNDWELTTRSVVGAKMYFYKDSKGDNKTFRQMFLQTCDINFDDLNKEYCYSFVLQHKDNRIVKQIVNSRIYLIKIYKINLDYTIEDIQLTAEEESDFYNRHNVYFPVKFKFNDFDELKEKWTSMNTPYYIMGVVVYNKQGVRTKFRNENYEMVRKLRGNEPKLQYHYLNLRKTGKVSLYLNYFKEHKSTFSEYRDMLHMVTRLLYKYYCECYKKKMKPLMQFPSHYRPHMYRLHDLYLKELKNSKKYISLSTVIEYVNNLHPSQQMFVMNYNLRKSNKEETFTKLVEKK